MKRLYSALLVALLPTIGFAQSTAQSVSAIFQANCTTGCHSGGNPSANLDLSGNPSDLISALVGVDPLNPAAAAKGYKLIDAGYPHNSFLLYKCATLDWDGAFGMDVAEGNSMPQNQPALAKEEIELIRQWIVYGAKQNGTFVDPQTLDDYYNDNGMARIEVPAAPPAGEGFQMHLGPFFLEPGEEVEFYKKEQLLDNSEQNIVKFEGFFNDESHHFLLFELDEQTANGEDEGLRPVGIQNAFQNPYMVGWVDPDILELPAGTAYKIEENSSIDLNYHIINYASNGDSVLAAEVYINFWTDNDALDLIEMESDLLINLAIFIPNNGNEVSFTDAATFDDQNSATDSIYIWFLSSHTHKYGTDYDIYKRNPDGSQGEQLYEGFYNTQYTFNQGYYDWEHPGNLYLDEVYGEMIPIAEDDGLIQIAKYQIPGSANETAPVITFGLTTEDEMMLSFIQYTRQRVPDQQPDGIFDANRKPPIMSVYPNPTNGLSTIQFDLAERANVQLTVYNSLGQEVNQVYNGMHAAGQARFEFDASAGLDPNGLYLIQLLVDGNVYNDRLLHLKR
ncbi:MAG: T9SS type A sorting domain-containing protein [Flavobacteriales bacterium]|nr:T9SS type A sorting domain-containing protein [Flavobacteriales bacterium]MCB9190807.1 T9SS type A sorting domain-containing protein [Flavobacteriales bacterium]